MKNKILVLILAFGLIGIASAGIVSNTPTLSNLTIDVGQISVANTVVSGGVGLYTGEWTWIPSTTNPGNIIQQIIVNTIKPVSADQGIAITPNATRAVTTASTTAQTYNLISNSLISTINLGASAGSLYSVVINPNGQWAYASTPTGINVISIGAATSNFILTATSAGGTSSIALSPDGSRLYEAMAASVLNVISTTTNSVINTITTGISGGGDSVIVNPNGQYAYLSDGGGKLLVIGVASNSVVNTISLGNVEGQGMAINPSGTILYILNHLATADTVNVIAISGNGVTIVNNILVGFDPKSVVFNPSGTLAYVTNQNSNTISVINIATNSVINTIQTGVSPLGIAIPTNGINAGMFAYDTESTGTGVINTISLPETALQPLNTIQTNNGLLQLTISAISSNSISFTFNGVTYTETPQNGKAIYGNYVLYGYAQDGTTGIGLTGINTTLQSNTIQINSQPVATQLTPSNTVLSYGQGTTFNVLISGGTGPFTVNLVASNGIVLSTITGATRGIVTFSQIIPPIGSDSYNVIATDTGTTTPYAFNSISNTITVTSSVGSIIITKNTIGGDGTFNFSIGGAKNIITGNFLCPDGVVFSPTSPYAYISNFGANGCDSTGDNVLVINTITQIVQNTLTVSGGSGLAGIGISANGQFLYVGSSGTSTIYIVNAISGSTLTTIGGITNPSSITVAPGGTFAYATDNSGHVIYVINTISNTVSNTINLGINSQPWGIAFNPSGNLAYVTSDTEDKIYVINTVTTNTVNTISGFTSHTQNPYGIAYSPIGNYLWVSNYNNITVVNTISNSIIENITNFQSTTTLFGLAFNPTGAYAYGTLFNDTIIAINAVTSNIISINTVGGTGTASLNNILTGTYSIIEQIPQSWYLTNSICNNLDTTNNVALQPGNTITCNFNDILPPLTFNSIAFSSNVDVGQIQTASPSVFNGLLPYTYNIMIFNSVMEVVNQLIMSYNPSNSFSFIQNPVWGTGTFTINTIVTDSNAPTVTVMNTVKYLVVNTLSLSIFPLNPTVGHANENAIWTGGTPAYTLDWSVLESPTFSTIGINNSGTPAIMNTIVPISGSIWFCAAATNGHFIAGGQLSFHIDVEDANGYTAIGNQTSSGICQFKSNGAAKALSAIGINVISIPYLQFPYINFSSTSITGTSNSLTYSISNTPNLAVLMVACGADNCDTSINAINTGSPGSISAPSDCILQNLQDNDGKETTAIYTCSNQNPGTYTITASQPAGDGTYSLASYVFEQINNNAIGTQIINSVYSGSGTSNSISPILPIGLYQFVALLSDSATINAIVSASTPVNVINVGSIIITKNTIGGDGTFNFNLTQNSGGVTENTITNSLFEFPTGVAFSPTQPIAVIANWAFGAGHTVTEINTISNAVINTFNIINSIGTDDAAFNPTGTDIYISSFGTGSIIEVNAITFNTINTISGLNSPSNLAVSPNGEYIYVTENNGDGTGFGNVISISTATNSIIGNVALPNSWGVAFNPGGTVAYVSTSNQPTSNIYELTVGSTPEIFNIFGNFIGDIYGISVAPNGNFLYAITPALSKIQVINTLTSDVETTIQGFYPSSFSLDVAPSGNFMYLANGENNTVQVISVSPVYPPQIFSITTSGGTGSTELTNLLAPTTYTIAESLPPYWVQTSSSCNGAPANNIFLQPGNILSCVFLNTANQPIPFETANSEGASSINVITIGGTPNLWICGIAEGNPNHGLTTSFTPDVKDSPNGDTAIGRQAFNGCHATDAGGSDMVGVAFATNTAYSYNVQTATGTSTTALSLSGTAKAGTFSVLIVTCGNGQGTGSCDPSGSGSISVPSSCYLQNMIDQDMGETAAIYTCSLSGAYVFSALSPSYPVDISMALYTFNPPSMINGIISSTITNSGQFLAFFPSITPWIAICFVLAGMAIVIVAFKFLTGEDDKPKISSGNR